MPTFRILSGSDEHRVEAANWMAALGSGLGHFGLSEGDLSRVICDLDPTGIITVCDPASGASFLVEEVKEAAEAVSLQVGAGTPAEPEPEPSVRPRLAEAISVAEPVEADDFDAPDPRTSPAFETVAERSADSIEALVDAAAVLETAETTEDACRAALDLAGQFIPAESGAVLLLTPGGDELVFVAATGPRSGNVRGLKIPADKGLAGVAVSSRTALLLREVWHDARHFDEVDKRSGYATQAILVVPLRGPRRVHGCLELLNPFGVAEFEDWHLEAAQMLGARLASRLG
ncbi:MAG TPA: GAF domain-containing protein [Myxococcota bacterium]|nr:GAF domain-containing protein [Myxococcota bacterium]